MKTRLIVALVVSCTLFQGALLQAQAQLPAGWPNRVELGMADGPGGAAAMRATAPFAFRYRSPAA